MKIFSSFALAAMLLLSSCGSDNTDARETVRPVDAWQPFVQVAPPGNIWNVQTNEDENYPPTMRIAIPPMTRQERMAYEIHRLYSYFAPSQTQGGWIPEQHFPDYFGGLAWSDNFEYMIVLIVEGMEDEAAEFLAFLDDFRTVEIHYSRYSFNELMNVQHQIWDSEIYPLLWWSRIDPIKSSILVYLFGYSEQEKQFFREFVTDSPIIDFACVFEVIGEDELWPLWGRTPTLLDQLENVTISVQSRNTFELVISFHNDSNYTSLVATDLVMEAYMNGRWIPIIVDPISSARHPSADRLFFLELGTSDLMISTGHFTRTFEGPYRVNVHIWHGDRSSPHNHRLTYVFSHGG